jgi:hypothetical protein
MGSVSASSELRVRRFGFRALVGENLFELVLEARVDPRPRPGFCVLLLLE